MAVAAHAVTPAQAPHPVDVRPPLRRLVPLSLQHLLVAYAGMATMPLLVGTALHLPEDRIRLLISANLLVSGLATLLQSLGVKWFGARLPIVMGSTFTAITPAVLIGEEHGLAAVFGATIVSGLVTVAVAPWFGRCLHLFPPLVTGTVIAVIGFSLVPSAAGLVTGGGGGGRGLALAAVTVLLVVIVERLAPPAIGRFSVLVAMAAGTVLAVPLGLFDGSGVADAAPVSLPHPTAFGAPVFLVPAIAAMLVVQLVNMVESVGDTLAVGQIVERGDDAPTVVRALRADGAATVVSGALASFPIVTFGQSVGLVSVTRVRSRHVVALSGALMVLLAFVPVLGAAVAAVPGPVLGGVSLVMFGTVGAVGLRILARADLTDARNLLTVALAFGLGLIPVGAPEFYAPLPAAARTVLDSGIAVTGIVAFALNLLFHHTPRLRKEPVR
ncbi:uracil-xanthine permease family protein [Streptomyces longispororuber]|uniref:uracil-xanthine permease family protein n=1 Tax=Streptomyces longispororuber TaxID=68230 RepID=UPI002108BD55|nr:nucleobase:cation symporter-2 family protein [Streptomyces longispororuber]MCQ4206221.1 purine permease [Streptomyces longispororuber]